jgi:hypothetical protein
MPEFRVKWEIDVDGNDPIDAALEALEIMRDPKSIGLVFHLRDKSNKRHEVDLCDPKVQERAHLHKIRRALVRINNHYGRGELRSIDFAKEVVERYVPTSQRTGITEYKNFQIDSEVVRFLGHVKIIK